jgi:hypothetical protein
MPKPILPGVCPACGQPKTYIIGWGRVCLPCLRPKQQAGAAAAREKKKSADEAAKGTK